MAITVAAALGVGGLTVLKTSAVERTGAEGPLKGHLLERAKEKLGLTDEQAAKIKSELQADKDNLASLARKLHEAHISLREAIHAADANESSVRAAAAKVAQVEADIAVERLKLYWKISPILTSEQREKLKLMQERIDDFLESVITRIGDRLAE